MSPRRLLLALLLVPGAALGAYDANGVALGGSEQDIKKAFPSALCKPLEWATRASDRRCDDARIPFAGVEARVTFYLLKDAIQAFDLRFDTGHLDKVLAHLKTRYGKPMAEAKDSVQEPGKPPREVYKARWEKGADRAVLVSQMDKKRATLTVSRGNWEEEIYRVR